MLDVKQFHLESTFLSLFANYHFEKEGELLNEGIELGMIGVENNDKISLKMDPFDEKSAKFHTKKVYELLENPSKISEIFSKSSSSSELQVNSSKRAEKSDLSENEVMILFQNNLGFHFKVKRVHISAIPERFE